MKRILLTGITGTLGSNIEFAKSDKYEIIGVSRTPHRADQSLIHLDLSDQDRRKDLVKESQADIVINCAAITSLEFCESNETLSTEINTNLALDLAEQSAIHGVRFIQISTDAVFDGVSGNYHENSVVKPLNKYGQQKLLAEIGVRERNPAALIVRTNFYGWSPLGNRTISEFFVNGLAGGQALPGFVDAIVSFTDVDLLIERLFRLTTIDASGTVHVGSSESISKFEFARQIAKKFGFDERLIIEARSSSVLSIERGRNLSLDTGLCEHILNFSSPSQADGISSLWNSYNNGRREKLKAFSM